MQEAEIDSQFYVKFSNILSLSSLSFLFLNRGTYDRLPQKLREANWVEKCVSACFYAIKLQSKTVVAKPCDSESFVVDEI